MVRRGAEPGLMLVSQPYDAIQRKDRRRENRENRIQSGRSRVRASNRPCRQDFSCGEADEGEYSVGLDRRG